MKVLLLSAQKPDNTGSGVFLKELARSFAADGHRVCIIAGIAAEDEFAFPAGIDFHPVRFETDALPFPVVGMSDEMPYKATRYRELDDGMLRAFYAAFDAVLDEGWRTRDIASADTPPDRVVGTERMGDLIVEALG